MEAKHRVSHNAMHRKRLASIANEGRETIRALAEGKPAGGSAAYDWEKEKSLPPSDFRTLMAAVLLIIR